MKEIELLKIIFKDSPDILEPLNKIDKEIERLNNIINELSKENQELKEKTKLFHKNRVFSLEYDKETLRDMVLEYQERIDKAIEYFVRRDIEWGSYEQKVLLDILRGE